MPLAVRNQARAQAEGLHVVIDIDWGWLRIHGAWKLSAPGRLFWAGVGALMLELVHKVLGIG